MKNQKPKMITDYDILVRLKRNLDQLVLYSPSSVPSSPIPNPRKVLYSFFLFDQLVHTAFASPRAEALLTISERVTCSSA